MKDRTPETLSTRRIACSILHLSVPQPARSADVVVGLLTENTSRMLTQAIRLLRSLRWFGGELAGARVVVCGVGPLESGARAALEELGGEVRTVSRFHPANPAANRHQLLAQLLEEPQEILFLLDCDTIVVQDPLPYLTADAFRARIAPTPTVSDEVFERLFTHFGLPKPPRSRISTLSGTPTIPYFNSGVLVIPKTLARTLAPVWRRYNQALADRPELVAPCQRHMHQASLALALAETRLPCVDLPAEMNFQINATHVAAPRALVETDPVILHYHHLATDDGYLLPCSYAVAQARIDLFHERMRSAGFVQKKPPAETRESRPILVLGMHRSGTSVVAELLDALGVYAGRPDELIPPDMFNPTGHWEHAKVVRLDDEVLATLGSGWADIANADLSRLSNGQRAGYVERAGRVIAQSFSGREAFLLKDPRLSLLFPIWREVLQNPVCIIVWRDPMAVARSLATRDHRPLLASLAIWEHYNRTLLRDTEEVPRLLVSYEELMAEPIRVVHRLHAALSAFGIEGLGVPTDERIRQIVEEDFNRSGKAKTDDTLLDTEQRALLAALRDGSALRVLMAPTSPRAFELLAQFDALEAQQQRIADQVTDLDQLLGAVFESRSWRIGHAITAVFHLMRQSRAISAVERWREMRRRRTL